jgi:hypothetical protein
MALFISYEIAFSESIQMRKPDVFIVGGPKCGTTSLYTYLKQHPDIFMSEIKEPQYFAADTLRYQRRIQTLPEYMDCFAAAKGEERIGEASTAYLGSRGAARELKKFNPNARIIVMLRNPIDVMYSLHSERLFSNMEHIRDFGHAINSTETRTWRTGPFRKQPVIRMGYREVSRFSEQLQRYFEVFGRESVHVIIYEDLKMHCEAVYDRVLNFLNVRPYSQPSIKLNANKRARSQYLQAFLDHPPRWIHGAMRSLVPDKIRPSLVRGFYKANVVTEPRPPMDECLRKRLQKEYEQEVVQLSAVLQRDLTAWCRA